jgi:hypothetical protein
LRPSPAEVDGGVARFLRDEVLPAVADPHLRRGLKTAAALLETGARRAGAGDAERRREAAGRALLDDLAAAGLQAEDVEEAAERLESGEGDPSLRGRVRRHLVADLAVQREPLEPLRRLFGRG